MAFRSFNRCYQLSSSEDRPSILERLLFTRFSTGIFSDDIWYLYVSEIVSILQKVVNVVAYF